MSPWEFNACIDGWNEAQGAVAPPSAEEFLAWDDAEPSEYGLN